MRLRALEIQGFKSFPDKTTLTFDRDITAVVGPNGSGKSNIADAVRWVLGEQSTKTLRGGKMEDVIFSGTQTRKAVGFAQVQLTIDNSDRALNIEEDTVTITRKLYRSGESEYRLSGAAVRLKDIHELLMDTGLGRDGYSIIGQGRIAEIVSARSVQRREIFEEAAGIAKYRYRKEEAERRLAHAEENLLRLRDILSALEERVGPLKIQAEKAKQYLALSEQKKSLEISLWMLSLDKLKTQLAAQQDKLDISKNQYERMERESAAAEQQLSEIYTAIQHIHVEMEEKRSQIHTLEETITQEASESAVLENDIHHNLLSIERLEAERVAAGQDTGQLQAQITKKQAELEEKTQTLDLVRGRVQAAEERLADQREQAARAADTLLALVVRRDSLNAAIAEARMSRVQSTTLLEENAARADTLQQYSGADSGVIRELHGALAECEYRLAEQQDKIASLTNTRQGYLLKRQGRAEKLDGLQKQNDILTARADQHRQRARLLEEMEDSLEGFAGSVRYILGQAKKGALHGVHGAVSSLMDTESQYTVAIETALGAAMQNIVVEDETTAKRAIRMLQNAKAGRATFLPLTSVKGGRDLPLQEMTKHSGFIGSAAQLVRADSRYSGIVSQLLGRVAIAGDLDCGAQIAKATGYQYRIVTLDGQVVHAGGLFTGGSAGRSAGVLGRRHEIERLKQQAAELDAQAETIEVGVKAAREELAALDAYIQGAQAECQTAQEESVRLGYQRQTLTRELEQAEQTRQRAQQELQSLLARMETLRTSHDDAQALLDKLDSEMNEVTASMEAATARKDMLSMGTETAAQQCSELKMAVFEAEKDREITMQELAQMNRQLQSAGQRAELLDEQHRALLDANSEIQRRIVALEARRVELRAEVEAMNIAVTGLMEQRNAHEAETTALRAKEREIAAQREGVSRELTRLGEHCSVIQSEYDGIIARLWEEYELTRRTAAAIARPIPDREKAQRSLAELRGKIKAIGTVNVDAVEEYAQVSERYHFLRAQVEDVEHSRAQLLKLIRGLVSDMRSQFEQSFHEIASHFSTIFMQLFGGGHGELVLTDGDVLEAGIEIRVQPPGKVIRSLSLLSGGEQAFVAIAIYFAILKVRPAPFCLLDEIEAALDDVNVARFAAYLRQMSAKTQFITITHRRGTMEEADVLYGVTMQDEGVSKLLELRVSEVEETLGI